MEMNGGFLVTKIKQLGDRIFEKILSEKNIDAFNGAQGRILYVLWQEDGISIRSLSIKCGLAITSLTPSCAPGAAQRWSGQVSPRFLRLTFS